MDDIPYAKREIDDKFGEIKDQLDRIEDQTTKTNGKVASVTKDFNKWKYLVTGFCVCMTVILLPLLWALIQVGKI